MIDIFGRLLTAAGIFLSAQFYGGKPIMKKRFKSILLEIRKRRRLYILTSVVVLAVSLGMLTGCSRDESDNEMLLEESGKDNIDVPEIVLKKAEEHVAEWYSIESASFEDYCFTDWRIESLIHCYTYEDFEGMVLEVYRLNYEYLSGKPENVILAGETTITEDGWVAFNPNSRYIVCERTGEELSFLVYMFENDCFPGDEVFSNDLKYQLESIGILAGSDNDEEGTAAMPVDSGEMMEEADIQEIKSIIEEFAAAYFDGDADTLKKYLTSPYEGDIDTYDTYEGTGTVNDFIIKGLPEAGEENVKNKWEISLEFIDSNEDSCTYLTLLFVKQEDSWKISSYGLEK